MCSHAYTNTWPHLDDGGVERTHTMQSRAQLRAGGSLEINYKYKNVFLLLRSSIPASASNINTTSAVGLIEDVLPTLLPQPKSFPFQMELQGNKAAEKERERGRER